MTSSVDGSPTSTPCGTPLGGAPKFGTVIPNRIFVGGIAANTTEQDLKQFFATYGAVKDSKIIADRAGVSKGYGFITFENQEDAERIIKKEVSVDPDNFVFRDRKLNIGPAIRKQQVLPRAFESPVSQGAVLFSNGVPYTYQNGMAVFASPDGSGYAVPQAQPQTAMMVPQTPPMYVQPTYQVPQLSSYAQYQTSPQWASTAAAAVSQGQWRYMTQQSPTAALTAAAANPYMIAMQPELMYAQVPPQVYQPGEMTDTSMLDGGAGVEGSILPAEPSLQLANQPTTYVTEVAGAKAALPAGNTGLALQTASTLFDANTLQYNPVNSLIPSLTNPTQTTVQSTSKHPSLSAINYAPYQKPVSSARRAYTSPTFLVRNGNKVQCVMMPPKSLSAGQMTLMARPHEGTVTPPSGGRA